MNSIKEIFKNPWKPVIAILILALAVRIGWGVLGGEDGLFSQKEEEVVEEVTAKKVETLILGQAESKEAVLEKTTLFTSEQAGLAVAEYSGRITEVRFEVGDQVKKGQILAVFDQSYEKNAPRVSYDNAARSYEIAQDNYEHNLEVAEETLERAENTRKEAELDLKHAKEERDENPGDESYERSVETYKRLLKDADDAEDAAEESYEIALNSAELGLDTSKTSLQTARISYNTTLIKAPVSGTVAFKDINPGDYVSSGTVAAQVVGEGKLETIVSLNQTQADLISEGDSVEIEFDSQVYPARIQSISPIAAFGNQRFEVKIVSLENLAKLSNQTGKVRLFLKTEAADSVSSDVFYLPIESVNIGQRKTEVFILENDEAVSRKIETGQMVGKQIEVVDGLKNGDEVIIGNSRNLQEGEKVERE